MNLQSMKQAVTSKVGRQVLKTKKHAPTILFVGGVVGVAASAVLASKATLKLDAVLHESEEKRKLIEEFENEKYSEKDRNHDLWTIKVLTAKNVVKLYAPAIAVGVISVAALTGSHVVLTKRNAAVAAAYAALDKGFNEYRARVRDELGEEADREFRHGTETVIENVVGDDGKTRTIERQEVSPPNVPSIYAKFFDEFSTSWEPIPEYNHLFLNAQQNYANDLLRTRGHLFLSEVYDMLGIPRTKASTVVGWVLSKDGDNFVDFGVYNVKSDGSRAFVNGPEKSILLDFNVDGVIWDLIDAEDA